MHAGNYDKFHQGVSFVFIEHPVIMHAESFPFLQMSFCSGVNSLTALHPINHSKAASSVTDLLTVPPKGRKLIGIGRIRC